MMHVRYSKLARMTRQMMIARSICLLIVLSVFVSASGAVGAPPQTSQGVQAPPEVLTVTIHAVDMKARRLDVITGVGLALRQMKLQVDPGCEIRVAGAAARLVDLKAGNIVRIQYQKTPGGLVVKKIETVPVAGMGEKR